MPYKIKKENKIRKSGEYRQVYQEGVRLPGRCLILFHMVGKAETRVGITVSGKVGSACERNRAKRRIREALRSELEGMEAAGSFVFVATRRIKEAAFEDIRNDVRVLLAKAMKQGR